MPVRIASCSGGEICTGKCQRESTDIEKSCALPAECTFNSVILIAWLRLKARFAVTLCLTVATNSADRFHVVSGRIGRIALRLCCIEWYVVAAVLLDEHTFGILP